jgi:hypothetical protein
MGLAHLHSALSTYLTDIKVCDPVRDDCPHTIHYQSQQLTYIVGTRHFPRCGVAPSHLREGMRGYIIRMTVRWSFHRFPTGI